MQILKQKSYYSIFNEPCNSLLLLVTARVGKDATLQRIVLNPELYVIWDVTKSTNEINDFWSYSNQPQ